MIDSYAIHFTTLAQNDPTHRAAILKAAQKIALEPTQLIVDTDRHKLTVTFPPDFTFELSLIIMIGQIIFPCTDTKIVAVPVYKPRSTSPNQAAVELHLHGVTWPWER